MPKATGSPRNGFGDAVTPAPTTAEFPSILNQAPAHIRVYPRETVVAEKFEAMVQLGMTNSRVKDYYDLWFISRHFEFDGELLVRAIRATFDRRATVVPEGPPVGLSREFADDPAHNRQWAAFVGRLGAEAPPRLGEVIEEITKFVVPPATGAAIKQALVRYWKPQEGWRPIASK